MTFIIQTLNKASSTVNGIFCLCNFRVDDEWMQQKQNQWEGRWVISSVAVNSFPHRAGKNGSVHITGQLKGLLAVSSGADFLSFNPFHRDDRKHTGKMVDEDSSAKHLTSQLLVQKTHWAMPKRRKAKQPQANTDNEGQKKNSLTTEGFDVTRKSTRSVSQESARMAIGDQSGSKCWRVSHKAEW